MRDADQEFLKQRVGEAISAKYQDAAPSREDAPAVMGKLLTDVGLEAPNQDSDVHWLPDNPGVTVQGPLDRASVDELVEAYGALYSSEWVECPEPWQPGFFRLFASHISADRVLVSEVRTALQRYGIDTFVAHMDIEPTEEWQNAIEQALRTCHALAAFLTPNFHDSLWTDQEVGFVYGRGVLVLSLRMDRDPYGFLYKTQGLPCAEETPEQIAERILDVLLKRASPNDVLAEGLLSALEASAGFAEANARIKTFQRIASLPARLVLPLKGAPAMNNQVEGAWDVPRGIQDLLSRVK